MHHSDEDEDGSGDAGDRDSDDHEEEFFSNEAKISGDQMQ